MHLTAADCLSRKLHLARWCLLVVSQLDSHLPATLGLERSSSHSSNALWCPRKKRTAQILEPNMAALTSSFKRLQRGKASQHIRQLCQLQGPKPSRPACDLGAQGVAWQKCDEECPATPPRHAAPSCLQQHRHILSCQGKLLMRF